MCRANGRNGWARLASRIVSIIAIRLLIGVAVAVVVTLLRIPQTHLSQQTENGCDFSADDRHEIVYNPSVSRPSALSSGDISLSPEVPQTATRGTTTDGHARASAN